MFKQTLLASWLVIPGTLFSQTADDYFHGGAQNYIPGRKEQAKAVITTGLSKFPEDPKLKALAGLLKEEEKQEQQQNQNQQDQQKDQSQAGKEQDKKDQKPPQSQQQEEQPPKEGEQAEAARAQAGQMTPQQARQLLDAQKAEEAMIPLKPVERPVPANRRFKDW